MYPKRDRKPPKNMHPCAKDDPVSVHEDITNPDPILVENTYDGKIEFNFEQFGGNGSLENEYELMRSNPELYCLRACHKIGYYLQKVHQIDLLRMKV
jgi:hypothetical protein